MKGKGKMGKGMRQVMRRNGQQQFRGGHPGGMPHGELQQGKSAGKKAEKDTEKKQK
jgi:hypothetical protein